MKKNVRVFLHTILLGTVVAISLIGLDNIPAIITYGNIPLYSTQTELERFLIHLSRRESGNHSFAINQFGMMGKYQFSKTTLHNLRPDLNKETFLKNTYIQDSVVIAYLRANNIQLNKFIRQFDGRVFKGILVTRSGVLAAAHLGGSGNVMKWFIDDDPEGLADANGTSIRAYMKEFAGYNIGKYL